MWGGIPSLGLRLGFPHRKGQDESQWQVKAGGCVCACLGASVRRAQVCVSAAGCRVRGGVEPFPPASRFI